MHVANCEYLLLSISCKMNADQSLFVVDLNERRGDRTYLVWSIGLPVLEKIFEGFLPYMGVAAILVM